MQMTTRYMPALPRLTQRANPWPSLLDEIQKALDEFNYWTQLPKRPFPAANFCPLSSKPAVKVVYERPTIFPDLGAWQVEYFQPAPLPQAISRPKPLPRAKGRLERWLDNHRGALAFWKRWEKKEGWLR